MSASMISKLVHCVKMAKRQLDFGGGLSVRKHLLEVHVERARLDYESARVSE